MMSSLLPPIVVGVEVVPDDGDGARGGSLSEITRTLRCGGLRPRRVRQWLHSPDGAAPSVTAVAYARFGERLMGVCAPRSRFGAISSRSPANDQPIAPRHHWSRSGLARRFCVSCSKTRGYGSFSPRPSHRRADGHPEGPTESEARLAGSRDRPRRQCRVAPQRLTKDRSVSTRRLVPVLCAANQVECRRGGARADAAGLVAGVTSLSPSTTSIHAVDDIADPVGVCVDFWV